MGLNVVEKFMFSSGNAASLGSGNASELSKGTFDTNLNTRSNHDLVAHFAHGGLVVRVANSQSIGNHFTIGNQVPGYS